MGGPSRIPLVTTLLHRELAVAPNVVGQPEQVVAGGALLAAPVPAVTPPAAPTSPPPTSPATEPMASAPPPSSGPPGPPPPTPPAAATRPPSKPVNKKKLFGILGGGLALLLTLCMGATALRLYNPQWAFSDSELAILGDPWMDTVTFCYSGGDGPRLNGPEFPIGTEVDETVECWLGEDSVDKLIFTRFQNMSHFDGYRGLVDGDEPERPHDHLAASVFSADEYQLYWEGPTRTALCRLISPEPRSTPWASCGPTTARPIRAS